ncbi:hypothetical protein TNCV_4826881 [Trichonephila clavipes]|nr:hypothetical protein TNCV_4826881 [Trichonephila clavipes]
MLIPDDPKVRLHLKSTIHGITKGKRSEDLDIPSIVDCSVCDPYQTMCARDLSHPSYGDRTLKSTYCNYWCLLGFNLTLTFSQGNWAASTALNPI